MQIHYKVISIDPEEHSCVVRYYTDIVTEESLANSFDYDERNQPIVRRLKDGSPERCRTDYNLTIWNPEWSTDELHQYFMRCAPVDWFRVQESVANTQIDTSMSSIQEKIGVKTSFTEDDVVTAQNAVAIKAPVVNEVTKDEINQILQELGVKTETTTANT